MALTTSRRALFQTVAAGGAALAAGVSAAASMVATDLRPGSIAVENLSRNFDVEPGFHNLEAGYWSMMPRVVAEEYARHTAAVNTANAI